MLRSKRIHDYQEANLGDFRPNELVPFDLHLYFSANRHILIWRKGGEVLPDRILKKYLSRGMRNVWIHRDDLELWRAYIQPQNAQDHPASAQSAEVFTPHPETEMTPANIPFESSPGAMPEAIVYSSPTPAFEEPSAPAYPTPEFETLTDEGREIQEVLNSDELSDRHKAALAARAARQLITETVDAKTPEQQLETMSHARDAVRDILDGVLDTAAREVRDIVDEMWEISSIDPGMDHAVNVASFAVLFAMAFGRISADLLSDIALAALLHDIGLTQLPLDVVQTPWNRQQGRSLQLYQRHVDEGIRLLDEFAPDITSRVRPLIQQHHEKFDGSGYPLQLQGFQVNDIAQLLGMADALVSISSGQWDGRERTLHETFDELESLEKSRSFPQFFNPEVFSAVLRWIRTPGTLSNQLKASEVVRTTTRGLMKKAS